MKVFRQLEKSFSENIKTLQVALIHTDNGQNISADFSNILNIAIDIDNELFKVKYKSSIRKEDRTIKIRMFNIRMINVYTKGSKKRKTYFKLQELPFENYLDFNSEIWKKAYVC